MGTRVSLTARGLAALLVGAGCTWAATLISLPELGYIGVVFLIALVVSLATQFFGRKLDALTRTVSSELLAVGRVSTIDVHVHAQSVFPTSVGAWDDTLPSALEGTSSGVFPTIDSSLTRGAQLVAVRYQVRGVRRGIHKVGRFRVSTVDAFGFTRRHTLVGDATPVAIAPALVSLTALPMSLGEAGGSLHSTSSHLGEGSDNLIARPYAPGDSMRRIHWRATAHRDELMVRQEEKESTPRAVVILDRASSRWDLKAGQSDARDVAFETALSLVVSVAARLMFEGYLVHIVDQDGTALCEPLAEESDISGMLSAFATLTSHGSNHLADLRSLVSDGGAGPIVLVTSSVTVDDADALTPLAYASTFPLLFAVASDPGGIEACHRAGWRAMSVPAAETGHRDDTVASAWLAALEQGASRVDR